MAAILVELLEHAIPATRAREFVDGDPALGGVVVFEGVTRTETDSQHGPLVRLEYHAYTEMAQRQLRKLAEQAAEKFGAQRMAIIHRLGPVLPGETSVAIAVACGHRAAAFEACRWLIDMLKRDVPIWKRDVFEDGFVRWVEPEIANCQLPIANWSNEGL